MNEVLVTGLVILLFLCIAVGMGLLLAVAHSIFTLAMALRAIYLSHIDTALVILIRP